MERFLNRRAILRLTAAGAGFAISGSFAQGQSIRLLVPFNPGSGTDAIARMLAPELSKGMGVPVVVENKPGAAGNIATEALARSTPDGNTLAISGSWLAVNKYLFKQMRFDPIADVASVVSLVRQPMFLVVNPSVPANSVQELIQVAKDHPGKLTYGSGGVGIPPHLLAEMFKLKTRTDIMAVPFQGSGPALTAVLAGHVSMIFLGPSSTVGLIQAGKLRPLAVTGKQRFPLLPNVPTLYESGLSIPELDVGSWWGLSAPAGTPKPVIQRLNTEVNRILQDQKFQAKLAAAGIEPLGGTPEQYDKLVRSESETWGQVLRSIGVQAE